MPIQRIVSLDYVLSQKDSLSEEEFAVLYLAATTDEIPYFPPKPYPVPGSAAFEGEVRDILTETTGLLRRTFCYRLSAIENFHAVRIAREVACQLFQEQDTSHCLDSVSSVGEEVMQRLFDTLYGADMYHHLKRIVRSEEGEQGCHCLAQRAAETGALLPMQVYLMRLQERSHRP